MKIISIPINNIGEMVGLEKCFEYDNKIIYYKGYMVEAYQKTSKKYIRDDHFKLDILIIIDDLKLIYQHDIYAYHDKDDELKKINDDKAEYYNNEEQYIKKIVDLLLSGCVLDITLEPIIVS